MASYQDLESRVRSIEDRLAFVMKTFRMNAGMSTGVVDANGVPQVKRFDASMEELYLLSRSVPTAISEPAE